jgi:tetratricopeptide (TPR) repeat protein
MRVHRAYTYAALDRWREAVEDVNVILSKRSELAEEDLADAYAVLGYARLVSTDEASAIAACDKAIGLNPNHAGAYAYRGGSFFLQGKVAEAIADCSKSLDLSDDSPDALRFRAEAFLSQGNAEKAIEDADRAIALKPNDRKLQILRKKVLAKLR